MVIIIIAIFYLNNQAIKKVFIKKYFFSFILPNEALFTLLRYFFFTILTQKINCVTNFKFSIM